MGSAVEVMPGEAAELDKYISIEERTDGWFIDAGCMTLNICKPGSDCLAANVRLDGLLRASRITPVFLLERRMQQPDGEDIRIRHTCTRVKNVSIETAGPLECVVKFTGYYEDREKGMPFVIRMYVGLDAEDIRFDHTFIYTGVEERDFLKGMGLRFRAPLTGEAYNHHAKSVTDAGVFHEPAILMESRILRTGTGLKEAQLRGENLTQLTADSYTLQKRTKPGRCMLNCRYGRRTDGAMAISGEDGGIMLASRDFWQCHPAGLEVEGLAASRRNAPCGSILRRPSL